VPIEFRCNQCNSLLRVPDGSEGRDARCPQCQAVAVVPSAVAAAPAPAPMSFAPQALGPAPAASDNPYSAPGVEAALSTSTFVAQQPFQPTVIELGQVLDRAMATFKAQWGKCLLGFWAPTLLWIVAVGVATVTVQLLTTGSFDHQPPIIARLFLQIFSNLTIVWLAISVITLQLKAARGMDLTAADFFGTPYRLLSAFVAGLVFALAAGVGLLLFILPYFYVVLLFSQVFYVIADRDAGPIEALKMSAQATKGNKLTLILLFLVIGSSALLGIALTCFVGAIIVYPIAALTGAVTFLEMTGQKPGWTPPERERSFGGPVPTAGT
jgi:phage FluMu protein Com/uncharacterized membrane protein